MYEQVEVNGFGCADCAGGLAASLGREQVVCAARIGAGAVGYIVFDSTVRGRSHGGLRLLPDVEEAELRDLALNMTLKYGFVGLPYGGAKAGIRGNPEGSAEERREALAAFGRQMAPLLRAGIYRPAPDMGTSAADIRCVLGAAEVPLTRQDFRKSRSGYHTALTVLAGVQAVAQHLGRTLTEATAAVEGFGAVGGALSELLAHSGIRIVAISNLHGALYNPEGLDVTQLSALATDGGSRAVIERYREAERIERAELFELPVDFLCPCARHGSVHAGNAQGIRARAICPGANNPVTPAAEHLLTSRGVICLPDFVTNCGGVLGGTMNFAGLDEPSIADFISRRIGDQLRHLLRNDGRQGATLREVALRLALDRFARISGRGNVATLRSRALAFGIDLYRRGWIPPTAVQALAPYYLERVLAQPFATQTR
jgi:glutamate dehydrogenase (NAD(P)+)